MINIYYLPARRQRLDKGIGKLLLDSGFKTNGRAVTPQHPFLARIEFGHLMFDRQVTIVREDLSKLENPTKILASGFGAYILLQALLDSSFDNFNKSIFLISPITGKTESSRLHSNPPYAKNLQRAISANEFADKKLTIVASSGEDPKEISRLETLTEKLHLLDQTGQMLATKTVWPVVHNWLRDL